MGRFSQRVISWFILCLTCLVILPTSAICKPTDVPNLNRYCKFISSSNTRALRNAVDGDLRTLWSCSGLSTLDIYPSATKPVGGIFLCWNQAPAKWELWVIGGDSTRTLVKQSESTPWAAQYVPVPAQYAGSAHFQLDMIPRDKQPTVLADISVFAPGPAPFYAPQWPQFPQNGRVDLLTFACHPDDEDLYLSVPAVTYHAQGYKTGTVYMTYGEPTRSVRHLEAQQSAWALGNTYSPGMGSFVDVKRLTKEQMMKVWPLQSVVGFAVEQIRKYKPAVIVTHDINGEYRHGGHCLTQYAVSLAFEYAADPNRYPESAKQYGTWKAAKLYVHLYRHGMLHPMSLTNKLSAYGGRTVKQVISDAYSRHKSQLPGRGLPVNGMYDMRAFGLFASHIGQDASHNSMFENVNADTIFQLNPWYNVTATDRTSLSAILTQAQALKPEDYTQDSWAASNLAALIPAATVCLQNDSSPQAQIDSMTTQLQQAIAALVPIPSPTVAPSPSAEPTPTPDPTPTPPEPTTPEPPMDTAA